MNLHQPMLNFEPSQEVQQHMLPEHRTQETSRWRKNLPPVQDGQPLNVDDILSNIGNACIIVPQD